MLRGASAASCAACPGVTWRGLGANTKPMASTFASAAAAMASALVMPQILIHMAPSVAILTSPCSCRNQDIRQQYGGVIAAHQCRPDQCQAVAQTAHGLRVSGRRHATF